MLDKEILTLDDIAKILNTSRSGAWRFVHFHGVPHRKVGKRILVLKEDFETFLKSQPVIGVTPKRK
ncbi:MAG: helix-turn-helix domain-containing protein [Ignisphaera sp.]